jgi:hypothetical protein
VLHAHIVATTPLTAATTTARCLIGSVNKKATPASDVRHAGTAGSASTTTTAAAAATAAEGQRGRERRQILSSDAPAVTGELSTDARYTLLCIVVTMLEKCHAHGMCCVTGLLIVLCGQQ